MSEGFINKSCAWMINMRSSKHSDAIRVDTDRNGKIESPPVFEENIRVTATKNTCLNMVANSLHQHKNKLFKDLVAGIVSPELACYHYISNAALYKVATTSTTMCTNVLIR